MISRRNAFVRAISPRIMAKVLRSFDKGTLLIIATCWAATVAVMIFALYTVNASAAAKRETIEALATEPVLPEIKRSGIAGKELQTMIDRLQHRYPELVVVWQNNALTIAGANGGVYRQWLNAIGQVDTLYPQFHWKIKGMCVGKVCGGQYIMNIDLVGDRATIDMPVVTPKE